MTMHKAAAATLNAVKARQQQAWSMGDYGVVGTTLQIVGEDLCEALDLRAGARVIDIAGGNGNASLAAARRWCDVVCTDYVGALLDAARERARAENLPMAFQVADAESLPFDDASFDVVISTFGVMFTPDQERAASELVRVCRPGGRIGLANWTPDGFIGQVFKLIGRWMPPPHGVASPASWGEHERITEMFGHHTSGIRTAQRNFNFRYRSPQHWIKVFRTFYGPINTLYEALDGQGQAELTEELMTMLLHWNRANDGTLVLPSKYLEVTMGLK